MKEGQEQKEATPAGTGAGNYDDVLIEAFDRVDSRISRLESGAIGKRRTELHAFALGFGLAFGLSLLQQLASLYAAKQTLRDQRFNDDLDGNPSRRPISSSVHQFHPLAAQPTA